MKFGKAIQEKLKYVHYNPVEAGLFYFREDYVYNRDTDYAGNKGYLDDAAIFEYFGLDRLLIFDDIYAIQLRGSLGNATKQVYNFLRE